MSVFFLIVSVLFIVLHVSQLMNNKYEFVKDNAKPIGLLLVWGAIFGLHLAKILSSVTA